MSVVIQSGLSPLSLPPLIIHSGASVHALDLKDETCVSKILAEKSSAVSQSVSQSSSALVFGNKSLNSLRVRVTFKAET